GPAGAPLPRGPAVQAGGRCGDPPRRMSRATARRAPSSNEHHPFSRQHPTCADCIAGVGVLTAPRLRPITSPSEHPLSTENGSRAHNCPKTLPISPDRGEIVGATMVSPTRPMSAVTTRPATQAAYQFLYTLHKRALGPYGEATWGWDEASQGKLFRDAWEPTANQVVLLGGEPIGCLRVEAHDDHVFVDYIALIPEHQRYGIGASLMRQLQAAA